MSKKNRKHPKVRKSRRVKSRPKPTVKDTFLSKLTTYTKTVDDGSPAMKKYFWGSVIFLFLTTIFLSAISGINGDDSFQNAYSDKITKFYTTYGQDTSCFYDPRGPIKYYGGLFELITGSINQTFDYTIQDQPYHVIRHVVNGLFGLAGILMVALWLKLVGGWQAALLGLWVCFLSPRYLGHSLMNPKDIPFAAGYIICIYFIAKLLRQFPKITKGNLAGLLAGIAIAFGIRAGGLIIVAYIALFFGIKVLDIIVKKFPDGIWNSALKPLTLLIAFVAGGLLIGIAVWPYALIDPLNHIPESLAALTNYDIGIKLLFQGEMMYGTDVPWFYHLVWMKNTLPLTIFLGMILLLFHLGQWIKKYGFLDLFLGFFCFAFPLIYIIIRKSNLYDGWRHVLFTFLPLAFLASAGWYHVLKQYWSRRAVRVSLLIILGLTALEPASFIARNPHFPYVYFNPLTGGLQGAFGKFETDYWGISAEQGARWLEKEGFIPPDENDTITIVCNFSYNIENYLSKYPNVRVIYVRYRERHNRQWDYGIFLSRFVSGKHLREGIWPPKSRLIKNITANGVPLAAVLKNPDDKTYQAIQANESGDFQLAIDLLTPELADHPDNEHAWTELGTAYQKLGIYTEAERCFKEALLIDPHNLRAYNFMGLNYLQSGNPAEAITAFEETLKFEARNSFALYYLAYIYRLSKDPQQALVYALNAIRVNPSFKQAFTLTSQIYNDMGDTERAEVYRRAAEGL